MAAGEKRKVWSSCRSFAKTHSPLVSIIWEMRCNVAELGYMKSR
jgi:hypothetical protein